MAKRRTKPPKPPARDTPSRDDEPEPDIAEEALAEHLDDPIPMRSSLTAADRHLRLSAMPPEHGKRVAVDVFFRTNGCGFDPEAERQSTGGTVMSMRERAALVGGRLDIESAADRGTSIDVRIPRSEPEA